MTRSPITRRDDAALPHEDVPTPIPGLFNSEPEQHQYDDAQDGNSTPNGGR